MAGDGYLRNRLLGWLLTSLGGFPVRQFSADREALRLCQALLSSGQPVVMFPEGTRRSGPVLGDVFGGVAFLAQRTGVPIIPVGIGGSERAMPRGKKTLRPVKIAIVIGKPIAPLGVSAPGARAPHGGSRRAAIELTERLRAELQGVTDLAMAATARPHRQELGRQEPGRQEPGR
jgi:1-acyl-sn-glycerol-3-phosphate acyltransferase